MSIAPLPFGAARRRFRPLIGWVVGVGVLVQLALFAYATAPGLAGTSDSRLYLHAAHTLRATGHAAVRASRRSNRADRAGRVVDNSVRYGGGTKVDRPS